MKTTVIYHSADFDGLFCREIARKFLPDAELIGWDFSDPKIPFPKDGLVYVLDLSPDCFDKEAALIQIPRLIWIDHHKSAIEKWTAQINGHRIDGVAACRLAWQWFVATEAHEPIANAPTKQDFIDRRVCEPEPVRLAGEYDIWDKRDPSAELFQHGLRSEDPDFQTLLEWPDEHAGKYLIRLLNQGRAIQYAKTQENESIIKYLGFTIQFEGLTFLACNHARYNSLLFTAGLRPEHDACLGFKFTGHCAGNKPREEWSISLYHAPGKEHHDLSKIAVKHGGGGHRGACGFITDKLPFLA